MKQRSLTNGCDFYARIAVIDSEIFCLAVHTWELTPLEPHLRPYRECIEEHIRGDLEPFMDLLDMGRAGVWESVFRGTLTASPVWNPYIDEWDEVIKIHDHLTQQLPLEFYYG
jgi:hypothetical protein